MWKWPMVGYKLPVTDIMSARDIEKQYTQLKREYDALLDKNQDDLVKIRIREKNLQEKLAALRKEREEEVRELNDVVDRLREQVKTLEAAQVSGQVKSKKQFQSEQDEKVQSMRKQWEQEKQKEIQKVRKKMKKEEQSLKESWLKRQDQHLNTIRLLKEQFSQFKGEKAKKDRHSQALIEQNRVAKEDNVKLEAQLSLSLQYIERLRSFESQAQNWLEEIKELKQQLELQREVTRSVRNMLRVRQMELQKLKPPN